MAKRDTVRLQKFLSNAGVASRRSAEDLITGGRVRVNGVVAELGSKVDPANDKVEVDGQRVKPMDAVWIALYKPIGYVTTRSDPQGRPTVYDLIPDRLAGLFHVGRLDYLSEGLVLLTNDGDLAHRLLHPKFEVERVYDVELDADISQQEIQHLLHGIELEDGLARATRIEERSSKPGRARLRVTMREGRNREVRRLFAAVGKKVTTLLRRRYGPIALGRMEPGTWRRLDEDEVSKIGGKKGPRASGKAPPNQTKSKGAASSRGGSARRPNKTWKSRESGR